MRNASLDEAQTGIKIAGRNINNLRYADDTTIIAESKGTKEPFDESDRGEWKSWLKTLHSKYIMQNARLDESQGGIKIKISAISNMQMILH